MKICVINPNSSEEMTQVIQRSAREFAAGEYQVDCIRNESGPPFIGCYRDMYESEAGMVRIIEEKQEGCDAFIIACHSDPALDLLKEISPKPVIGICEASVKLATMLGRKFSVISTGQRPIPHKESLCRKYGVEPFTASVRGPDELRTDWRSADSFIETGKRAVEEDGAEVLVLGCAGMGHVAKSMERALGVPVLDGVVCALIVAQGFVRARLSTSGRLRCCGADRG